jgi:hypothetical protein
LDDIVNTGYEHGCDKECDTPQETRPDECFLVFNEEKEGKSHYSIKFYEYRQYDKESSPYRLLFLYASKY